MLPSAFGRCGKELVVGGDQAGRRPRKFLLPRQARLLVQVLQGQQLPARVTVQALSGLDHGSAGLPRVRRLELPHGLRLPLQRTDRLAKRRCLDRAHVRRRQVVGVEHALG